MTSLSCERCVGRSLYLCMPLDDARLRMLLSLGGIRQWKKHATIFGAGAPKGAFFKIETVSRAIGELKNRDVISLTGSDEVAVPDNHELRKIAQVGGGGRSVATAIN